MKALVLNEYEADFKQLDLPKPQVKRGEVLIKVYSSGVNPIDNKIRIGKAPYATPNLPAILGTDMAGVIEEVGETVVNFKKGDEVYGLVGGVLGSSGTLAEYISVDALLIAKKPVNLTWREAAAIPLVALTAWEGIRDRIKFTGQTNDVRSFYQKSSIFCLSSRNEGLPMVLLEAQAYGLPIVAFDCDTGPSEIVVNKKNGFLIPNGNIDSLASHLNEVINFEEKKYKKMVFEYFLSTENFKVEKIFDKWVVIL